LSIIIGSAISNAGGIGGGGLFIPILILILEFYTHEAIPISKVMIFSGALTAFILNLKLRHPTRHTISIDYNIAILIVPLLLFGTVVGVTLNKITPAFLIILMLTLVLLINTYNTLKQAISIFRAEDNENLLKNSEKIESINSNSINKIESQEEMKMKNILSSEERINPNLNNLNNQQINHELEINQTNKNYVELDSKKNLVKIEIEKDQHLFQWNKLKYLILSYILMLFFTLIRGSEYFKSIIGIEKCSLEYWFIYFINFPMALLITYYGARAIREENKYRLEIGFPYDNHDIIWNTNLIIKYPIYGFFSGLIAGLVGIGGGLVLGPLLIVGDWGLGIGDWGLGIGPNPQSPIPNPQSPIP
jgi:uncharacterized membrane protein YfcA